MDESSILIIGSHGQLGSALSQKYPKASSLDSSTLDIASEEQVKRFDFSRYKVIINAAAYTDVDGAQSTTGRINAWQVNATAVGLLAKALLGKDCVFVHISTDYVFDGTHDNHEEDEALSPLGVYGQSKAAGDLAASVLEKLYLLRTSWVIGEGKNFVKTMLEIGRKGINPKAISDVYGRPTFTDELVRAIDYFILNKVDFGTYNVSNGGKPVSWADLTKAIYEIAGFNLSVTNISNQEYYADKPHAAPRPHSSVFDLSKLHSVGFVSHDWRDGLKSYINKELIKA